MATPADPTRTAHLTDDRPVIEVEHLSRRYRDTTALDDVSLTVQPDTITGLLGRNGAGKSTLMKVLTGQELASAGSVRVFGQSPLEHDSVLRRVVFIKEGQVYPDISVRRALEAASWCCPGWDHDLARELVADFDLPLRRPIKKLSRGMHSAVGIIIGLAARAELTFFDEPYLGLDAVARHVFYDRLLADYAEHPRTVVLSTHLIDEVANLLEQVVVIDRGRIVLSGAADELREHAVSVAGSSRAVTEFTTGRTVWRTGSLAGQTVSTVAGPFTDLDEARAAAAGLRLAPVSLQELVVAATGRRRDAAAELSA
ncbi:ABC transporter ATP-binding protein [Nakamurella leprariae]|uniref:ABC transporter ATP-binding protein n=1 Tax=Nakamurella leprariae TaxID=2803911 RepID=A0A938YDT1_9ACTN|nr:ABC transporter ATP-binding protein [Nakamurella leprariae]MBM9468857.1 ABC transporter ATP-binding protein [Nakamurella leprariae]